MKDRIEALRAEFAAAIADANTTEALENLRVAYLGKKGSVAELMKGLRDVADKKAAGALINTFKTEVETKITERAEELRAAAIAAKVRGAKKYNPPLTSNNKIGSYHPITLATREVEEIFVSMGFTIEDYAEVVDDYECFEALNIPKHHPARDMQDTYYLETASF